MKLAYISDCWGVPYSFENDMARAFAGLGWEVERLQERNATRRSLSDIDADLLLYTRHRGLTGGLVDWGVDAWRKLADRGIPTAGCHMDLFFGLDREELIATDPFFRLGFVFTPDGNNDENWEAEGVRHHFMPPGISAHNLGEGQWRNRYKADVTFIGSRRRYHRQWPWRARLLDAVSERYGAGFRMLGPEVGAKVRGKELADAIWSAKVVLGDSLMLGPRFWSDRVPETMGRSGVLVHPHLPPVAVSGYTEGVDYAGYEIGDLDSVFAQIDRLLVDDAARADMAWHGQFETARAHTYADRVRELILPTIAEDWPHLRGPEAVLRMVARSGINPGLTTDAGIIDEVWKADVYRLDGCDLTGQVVVDIGANIGAFTLRAASLGATVVAVEPEPGNRAVLEQAVKLAGLEDRVTVVAAAVGAERGRATTNGTGGGVCALPDPVGAIPMLTLDDVLPDGPIALLKMDAEGAECASLPACTQLHRIARLEVETHEGNVGRRFVAELAELLEQTHSTVESSGRPMETGYLRATR